MITVADIYNSVSHLGFEKSLDADDNGMGFYEALNRALLELNALRPATKHYVINHRPLENMIRDNTYIPVAVVADGLIYEADKAKSYYFEADGNGSAYIEAYDGSDWVIIKAIELSSRGIYKAYKGFVKQDGEFTDARVRIRFAGIYTYSVRNVCFYNELYSEYEEDIPVYGAYTRYDMSALVTDFLSLARPPIQSINRNPVDYDVEDRQVILLSRKEPKGTYDAIYYRRPERIEDIGDAANDMTVIDLDDDVSALMPNLIGLYLWAEDEPDLAQYYRSLYQEGAAKIAYSSKFDHTPCKMRSVNGW